MALLQSIDTARAERIGSEGCAAADLEAALERADGALSWLRERHRDGDLLLLRLPGARDDVTAIRDAGRKLAEGATDIVFFGTGGSSLGGQTLAQLAGHGVAGVGALRDGPRLHFIDNLDPATLDVLLSRLPLATTRFVAISKSGGTAETLMQTAAALAALQARGLGSRVPELFLGLTEPAKSGRPSGLRALLGQHNVRMLDHDRGIGGRFSVLSNVGLLPAAIVGLDMGAIRAGAADALAPVLDGRAAADVPPALGAALAVTLAKTRGKSISVVMAYADRLERFTRWYAQLWAESLGKDGLGTTPLAALGPVDQHSQLQLFIDGPRDKLFTVISVDSVGRGPRIPSELARLAGEPDFADRTIGDLVAAECRATAETLAKHGCPVRTIQLARLDEHTLGELLMHFMLETIVAARLLGVDAFDQPAVEEGKVLAKRYLKATG
jgi:glucose-6-phosphate isomerase